jgi:hypothetical protein
VFACPGSQILESTISIDKIKEGTLREYVVTLKPGLNYEDNNFAFSRGGVIKRVHDLKVHGRIEIPTGHCLIDSEELRKIEERNDGKIWIFQEIEGKYFIISAQYSHSETYEQFYDPARYNRVEYRKKVDVESLKQKKDEKLIDLRTIDKSGIEGNAFEQGRIQEIYRESVQCRRMIFLDKQGGAILIEGNGT